MVSSFGGGLAEFPVEAEHLLGLAQRVDHHPSQDCRADDVESILEGGDDAEIAAATAQAPEEILVLRGAGRQKAAVAGDLSFAKTASGLARSHSGSTGPGLEAELERGRPPSSERRPCADPVDSRWSGRKASRRGWVRAWW